MHLYKSMKEFKKYQTDTLYGGNKSNIAEEREGGKAIVGFSNEQKGNSLKTCWLIE